MPKSVRFESVRQKSEFDLPASYAREIGKIAVRWAYYERYIQTMIWAIALGGYERGTALGRLAIREVKPEDQLDLLKNVADIRAIELDLALIKSMKPRAKDAVSRRNLVAHGLWTRLGAEWLVQQTRGQWEEYEGAPKGSKKYQPEAVPVDAIYLRQLVSDITDLIADARTLKGSIGEA